MRDKTRLATTQARQIATSDDYISIKEVLAIFITQGRPITERTLQRYCDKKQLVGQKVLTGEGEKWFVLRSSVFNRIAELEVFDRLRTARHDTTGRDLPAAVVDHNITYFSNDSARQTKAHDTVLPTVVQQISSATDDDISRQDTTSRDLSRVPDETVEHKIPIGMTDRERKFYEQLLATYKDHIDDLVKDKSLLQEDKKMLVEQLLSKDRQIDHFFSSERDTKKLFGSLQNIMTYLWPGSKRKEPSEELPQAYGPVVRDMPTGLDHHEERGH